MALTDKEQAREFEHNRKIQNDFIVKIEQMEKDTEKMAMEYGIELQKLTDENEDLKKKKNINKELSSEVESLKSEIKILKNQQMKESEAKIVYNLYPKLLEKSKEKETKRKSNSNDRILILLRGFIKRNSKSGYVKSVGIIRKIDKLLKGACSLI